MAIDGLLPTMTPFTGKGDGSGTNLFNLSGSVKLDATAFYSALTQVMQSVDNINSKMTSVVASLNTLVATSYTGIRETADSALSIVTALHNTADKVTTAINETDKAAKNVEGSANDATAAVEKTGDAVEDVDKAAEGATEAAEETEKAVERMGTAAQQGGISFESFLQVAQNVWGTVTDVAGVLWDIGSDFVSSAMEMEQEERRFASSFKGIEDDANAALESISETTGYHTGLLRGNFTAINTQLRAAGYTNTEALAMSQDAMLLAADAAATYGISMDEATSRVLSFMRGNIEAGESIGLFTSAATRDQYASELYGKKWKDLTEAERENVMLQIGMGIYGDAGLTGAAKEYADSFAVAMQNLQRVWVETKAILGTPIMNAVTPVIERLTEWLTAPENAEKIQNFADAIGKLVGRLSEMLIDFIEALTEDPTLVDKIINMVIDFIEALAGLIEILPTIVDFLKPFIEAGTGNLGAIVEGLSMIFNGDILGGIGKIVSVTSVPGIVVGAAGGEFGNIMSVTSIPGGILTPIFGGGGNERVDMPPVVQEEIEPEMLPAIAFLQAFGEVYRAAVEGVDIPDEGGYWNLAIANINDPLKYNKKVEKIDAITDSLASGDTMYQSLYNAIVETLGSAAEDLAAALNGATVEMDGEKVGHLVAPTVMGDMARSVRGARFTGSA